MAAFLNFGVMVVVVFALVCGFGGCVAGRMQFEKQASTNGLGEYDKKTGSFRLYTAQEIRDGAR